MLDDLKRMPCWMGATFLAWLATAVILVFSTKFYGWLGTRGLAAMERLMGMLLIMISVQMLLNGVIAFVAAAKAA